MDQVLLTFGFTFIFYDLVQTVWGKVVLTLHPPKRFRAVCISVSAFSPRTGSFSSVLALP